MCDNVVCVCVFVIPNKWFVLLNCINYLIIVISNLFGLWCKNGRGMCKSVCTDGIRIFVSYFFFLQFGWVLVVCFHYSAHSSCCVHNIQFSCFSSPVVSFYYFIVDVVVGCCLMHLLLLWTPHINTLPFTTNWFAFQMCGFESLVTREILIFRL